MPHFYEFRQFYIPERMGGAIERYIFDKIQPGRFLTAVIENNLKEACFYADDENMKNIPAYVSYFYNHAPHSCWGSAKEMNFWLNLRKVK